MPTPAPQNPGLVWFCAPRAQGAIAVTGKHLRTAKTNEGGVNLHAALPGEAEQSTEKILKPYQVKVSLNPTGFIVLVLVCFADTDFFF